MAVRFHPHALNRITERGATLEDVEGTVQHGEQFPAKFGRIGFRRNFSFGREWRGRIYSTKQLETYAVQEGNDWLVITVIVRFF